MRTNKVVRELVPGTRQSRTALALMFLILLLLIALILVTFHYSTQLRECQRDLATYETGPGKYLYVGEDIPVNSIGHNLSQVHPIQVNVDSGWLGVGPPSEPH